MALAHLPIRHKPPLILLNKPFNVLCQFTDETGRQTRADCVDQAGYYPAGRLDRDSEGLVVLTNEGRLQAQIADPRHKMAKTYLAQVEGEVTDAALAQLARGVMLNDGLTLPAEVRRMTAAVGFPTLRLIRWAVGAWTLDGLALG